MLAASAGRLMRPALSACLVHLRSDWQATRDFDLAEGQRLLRADAEGHSVQQQAEIDALRDQMAAALAAKEEQLLALSERSGMDILSQAQEAARALADKLEEQKELRVAHVQQMAVRRLGKQQLSKGWQTWLDGWLEHQRHKRMLAAAAGRLMKPALSAALTHWRTDWQATQQAILAEGQRLLRAELEGNTIEQQAKIDALREEMAAALAEKDETLRKLMEQGGGDLLTQEQEHAKAMAEQAEAAHQQDDLKDRYQQMCKWTLDDFQAKQRQETREKTAIQAALIVVST